MSCCGGRKKMPQRTPSFRVQPAPVHKTRCNLCGGLLEERAHRIRNTWVRRMWCSKCEVNY